MASTSPSRSCRCASAITRIPASRAAAVVWGPIETAGMPGPERAESAGGGGRGEHDDIAGGRRRTQLGRPVERQEVRAELVDDERAGALGGGEEHAPGRSRQLGEQALLRRHHGYEIHHDPARASAAAVPGPIAATRPARPRARDISSSAPFGLVTMSQSYPDRSIGPQPIGSTRMRGQSTTSWPSSATRDARGSAWPGARVTTTLIFRQRAPGARARGRPDRRGGGARSSGRPRRR